MRIQCRTSLTYLNPCSIILFVQDHLYRQNYLLVIEIQSAGKYIPPLTAVVKMNACPPPSRHPTSARSDVAGLLIREILSISPTKPMLSDFPFRSSGALHARLESRAHRGSRGVKLVLKKFGQGQ